MGISILYSHDHGDQATRASAEPDYFSDLNLDQVVRAITGRKQEYDLVPFYHAPLTDAVDVLYRQQVAQDLAGETLMAAVNRFAQEMVVMRRYLGLIKTLRFHYHSEGWFLEAVLIYCEAVRDLAQALAAIDLQSPGMRGLRDHVSTYVASTDFQGLYTQATAVKVGLAAVRYSVLIKGNTVRVAAYGSLEDLSEIVERTFDKFKQGATKDYASTLTHTAGMNHVGAQILDAVAKLNPEAFAALDAFCVANGDYADEIIMQFDREVQFYIAYLEHIDLMQRSGLAFSYPEIAIHDKEIYCRGGFDLALADQFVRNKQPVVPNDFYLSGPERIIVVSGPNQGGKTTFARMVGQLHYLARLGLPVPGREARLFLSDQIFTHFEREEDISNLSGKLHDDLTRVRLIVDQATPDSLIIMNEIFSSTTLQDAVLLSTRVMDRIIQLDLLSVWVTFIDELASLSEKTVSMVSTVLPDDPASRTYRIVRRPADGLSYAITIAEKHGLTRELLKERIKG